MNYPKSKIISVHEIPENTIVFDQKTLLPEIEYDDHFGIRASGEFRDKALYLDDDYDWQIVKDNSGVLCAVPTKKK